MSDYPEQFVSQYSPVERLAMSAIRLAHDAAAETRPKHKALRHAELQGLSLAAAHFHVAASPAAFQVAVALTVERIEPAPGYFQSPYDYGGQRAVYFANLLKQFTQALAQAHADLNYDTDACTRAKIVNGELWFVDSAGETLASNVPSDELAGWLEDAGAGDPAGRVVAGIVQLREAFAQDYGDHDVTVIVYTDGTLNFTVLPL